MNLGFDEITSINCFNLDSSLPYVNMSDLVEIHASDSETLLREEAEGEKENVPEDSEGEGEEEEEETNDKESEARTTEDSGVATETAEGDGVVKKPSFNLKDIPREEDSFKWELPEQLAEFFAKYAREHRSDADLENWIQDYPVPSNVQCVLALDESMKRALKDEGKAWLTAMRTWRRYRARYRTFSAHWVVRGPSGSFTWVDTRPSSMLLVW